MIVRVVNIHKVKDYDLYIGRGNCPMTGQFFGLGNPFTIGSTYNGVRLDRDKCLETYSGWLYGSDEGRKVQEKLLVLCAGMQHVTLGCFCHPLKCHGDVLALTLKTGRVI